MLDKKKSKLPQRWWVAGLGGALVFSTLLTFAYNPFQDYFNGSTIVTRWVSSNISWDLNPTVSNNNVDTSSGVSIQTALTNGFMAWEQTQLNGKTLNTLNITQGPNSSLTQPDGMDCRNVVSFPPPSTVSFSTGTIAFTEVTTALPGSSIPCSPGVCTLNSASCIIDADVVFNPSDKFSTSASPPSGTFDLQSVATHEFGHLLGLDHSGIAHAVMYPFGDTTFTGVQRSLAVDDVVGVAFLYPSSNFASSTGTISGRVTLNGSGAFAAHVLAIDKNAGTAVVDRLTNPDGSYKIVGVPPGSYNIVALPLAPDVDLGIYTIDDFSGWTCGYAENSPPCCDPSISSSCTGTAQSPPTNYTGKFY